MSSRQPQKNPNRILFLSRNSRAASTTYMAMQRTKNRQILENQTKERDKKTYFIIYQDILQGCITKVMWHCLNNEQIQQTKVMHPKTHPYLKI